MKNKNTWSKHIDFLVLDVLCICFSLAASFYFWHGSFVLFSIPVYQQMLLFMFVVDILLFFFTEPFSGVLSRGYLEEFKSTLKNASVILLLSVLYLFMIKSSSNYSRATLLLTYIIYIISSYVSRILYKKYLHHRAKTSLQNGEKSLLVICESKDVEEVVDNISKNNFNFYQISGICTIDKSQKNKNKTISKSKLLDFISTNWVDDILIVCDYDKIPNNIIKGIKESGIPVSIKVKDLDVFEGRQQTIGTIGDYNVLSSLSSKDSFSNRVIKRMIDIVGGIIGSLVTVLLIIVIGPIIYLKSPGNIFYVSDRVGKNGKLFKFYKFRSMILDADDQKEKLKEANRVKDGMMFKIENDPRIIPGIGNFIRKTSLDEFPQFFNVLKGDMSLVGTRPPTIDEWNKYTPYYRSRLSIKPGITGLWQISGRSNITDFNEVVRLDNEYINNWSISLDIKILFKTILVLINREGSM